MIPYIEVRDETGAAVLRYLIIEDHGLRYFGGTTFHLISDLDAGPHIWHHDKSMLNLIGRLATSGDHYDLVRGMSGQPIALQPEMNAKDLAGILEISVETIIKHYGLLVKVS
jgi:hypothetical protein